MPSTAPRPLTFWMAIALVMGNTIGSGIFLLPASLAPYGGLSLGGWLISSGGALMLAVVFGRLVSLHPAAGGPYAYTRRAFGDLPGFLVAWSYWISMWTSLGALAVAFTGYLTPFFPLLGRSPSAAAAVAIALVWLLVAINIAGLRPAGSVQVVTTVLKLIPLLAIGTLGVLAFEPARFSLPDADAQAIASGIPAVAALTLWAFLGIESATVPAGEIDRPGRNIPLATVAGTALVASIYILSTVGVMSLLEPGALERSPAPFADAAGTLGGPWAARAVALGAAISCAGALNGWTLLAGQLPLAVARDGLFPAVFARVGRRGTPAAGLILAGMLTTGLVALNYTRGLVDLFTFFILLATLQTLVPYVFASIAVFVLSDARLPLTRTLAVTAALAFVYSVGAMAGSGQEAVYWGFLLLVCGLPVYVLVTRGRRVA